MNNYMVRATVDMDPPYTYELVGDYPNAEIADGEARRAVRGGGYPQAEVTAPDGKVTPYTRPEYRPTGRIVNVNLGNNTWMVYSENMPAMLLEAAPGDLQWEQHTPAPVDNRAMDAIRQRLKAEITWWGGYFSENFHQDPAGKLPSWAEGAVNVVPGDIEEVPAPVAVG